MACYLPHWDDKACLKGVIYPCNFNLHSDWRYSVWDARIQVFETTTLSRGLTQVRHWRMILIAKLIANLLHLRVILSIKSFQPARLIDSPCEYFTAKTWPILHCVNCTSEPVGNRFYQLCAWMPSNHKQIVTFIKFLQFCRRWSPIKNGSPRPSAVEYLDPPCCKRSHGMVFSTSVEADNWTRKNDNEAVQSYGLQCPSATYPTRYPSVGSPSAGSKV